MIGMIESMERLSQRVRAAQDFNAERFYPFEVDGRRAGRIRRDLVPRLERWPRVFQIEERNVRLAPALASEGERSAALAEVTRALLIERDRKSVV